MLTFAVGVCISRANQNNGHEQEKIMFCYIDV